MSSLLVACYDSASLFLSVLSVWLSRWKSSMPNIQMISPFNLLSADVVSLFCSSNILLAQLLGVGKENFVWCVCVYALHMCRLCEHMQLLTCVIARVHINVFRRILCQRGLMWGQRNRWSTKWDMNGKQSQTPSLHRRITNQMSYGWNLILSSRTCDFALLVRHYLEITCSTVRSSFKNILRNHFTYIYCFVFNRPFFQLFREHTKGK